MIGIKKLNTAVVILIMFVSISYTQNIKVQNEAFKVINYTLIDEVLTYRIYDCGTRECISGGEVDAADLYVWTFISHKKGKYQIVIYLKPNRIFINENIEVE